MTKNLDPRDTRNILYRYTKLKYIQRALYAGVSYTTIMQLLAATFGLEYDLPSILVNYKSWSTKEGKESSRVAAEIADFSKAAGFSKEYEVGEHLNAKGNASNAADVDLSKWRVVQAEIIPESRRRALNDRDFLLESLSNDSMVDFAAIVSARYYQRVRGSPSASAPGVAAGVAAAGAAAAGAGAAAAPATEETSAVLYTPPSGPLPVPDISMFTRRLPRLPDWTGADAGDPKAVRIRQLPSAPDFEAVKPKRGLYGGTRKLPKRKNSRKSKPKRQTRSKH